MNDRNLFKDMMRGYVAMRIVNGQEIITVEDIKNDFAEHCQMLGKTFDDVTKLFGTQLRFSRTLSNIAQSYDYVFRYDGRTFAGQYINARLHKKDDFEA